MCNVDKMRVAKQPLPLTEPYHRLWIDVNKVIDRLHFLHIPLSNLGGRLVASLEEPQRCQMQGKL